MTERRVLPQRRACETFDLEFGGLARCHMVTVGNYDDGTLGEIFINAGKTGEAVEAIARDGAVLLSLALQFGVELANIRSAITRDGQGEPATIIGAVIDQLSAAAEVPSQQNAQHSTVQNRAIDGTLRNED